MKFSPLKTLLIGGALGGAMLIGAITLGPAGAADKATPTTTANAKSDTVGSGHEGHEGHEGMGKGHEGHEGRGGMHHPQLTEAQKKCLADAGFTKPATRPSTKPTEAQHKAFHAAATKCGINMPTGHVKA